jgi:hypothetical protein
MDEVERLRRHLNEVREERHYFFEQAKHLRGLLNRLEWAGTVVFDEWYDKGKCCPVCRAEEGDAHAPDCWLAAALKES